LKPLVVIAGPTGSGKSSLALAIAETFHGEIVNCDSLQLYRGMDIGTAKTPEPERHGIPHHLFDILSPDELYTAGDYSRHARAVLGEIISREKLPVVVGGTGFYLHALLDGLFPGPSRSEELRARLMKRKAPLHKLLARLDPERARQIHPNDTKKLIRALEICILLKNTTTSAFASGAEALEDFRPLKIGLDPPREELIERLAGRCVQMFERGLVDEVRHLLACGYAPSSKAFESIGYRETILFLEGKLTLEQAIRGVQISTRQYAKRQRTWFRRESGVEWICGFGDCIETIQKAFGLVETYLERI
jgi:tRNA dimethylallyltransferase